MEKKCKGCKKSLLSGDKLWCNRCWIELKNRGKTWLKWGGGAVGGYFVTKAVVNAQKEDPQQSEE